MKNILIPIDCKCNNYAAIDYAVSFFKREECCFYFLNTYTNTIDENMALGLLRSPHELFEAPKRDSETCLGRMVQRYAFKSEYKQHRFNAISKCTNLVEGIKNAVTELQINVVVIPKKEQATHTSKKYSKNTIRILDSIKECPVMIIPASASIQQHLEFVLVSNFETTLPISELESWYEIVKAANGSVKIVTLSEKNEMTEIQKSNQNKVRFQIEMLSRKKPVKIEYLTGASELKNFANDPSDYIICIMDKKPDFWQKCGVKHSKIVTLGPLKNTPIIALHR